MSDHKKMLFLGEQHYPSGGWGDFEGMYTYEEAAEVVLERLSSRCDPEDVWFQLVDPFTHEVTETLSVEVSLDIRDKTGKVWMDVRNLVNFKPDPIELPAHVRKEKEEDYENFKKEMDAYRDTKEYWGFDFE